MSLQLSRLNTFLSESVTKAQTFWDEADKTTKIGIAVGVSVSTLAAVALISSRRRSNMPSKTFDLPATDPSFPSTQPNGQPWPSSMKAAVQFGYSFNDFTKCVKFDTTYPFPIPSADEILIKVVSIGINPIDWKLVAGIFAALMPQKLPRVIGQDCTGIVVHVGSSLQGKTSLSVGDRVAAIPVKSRRGTYGAFAEYVVAKPQYVAKLPDEVSFDQGACLPTVGLTALNSLLAREYGALSAKMTQTPSDQLKVLVLGGSTASGSFGLQVCNALKIGTIATTSSQEELMKSYGATEVLNYKKDRNWMERLKQRVGEYDLVFDCVGGREHWECGKLVKKKNAPFVGLVGDLDFEAMTSGLGLFDVIGMISKAVYRNVFSPKYAVMQNIFQELQMDDVMKYVGESKIGVVMNEEMPLEFNEKNLFRVFNEKREGKIKGKQVLRVQTPE